MKHFILTVIAISIAGALTLTATEIKKTRMQPTSPVSGEQMYKAYCASCHGVTGKGDGPAAPALKKMPTDLTLLAKKNGGKFSEIQVYHSIQGDANLPSHGSADMPVWGTLFSLNNQSDAANVKLRLANLTKYIEKLQTK